MSTAEESPDFGLIIRVNYGRQLGAMMKKFSVLIIIIFLTSAVHAKKEDAVFNEIALKISGFKSGMKNGTVAVFPFETHGFSGSTYGIYAADKISAAISAAGKLTLVEREKLGSLLSEKELSMSGLTEEDQAAKIGTLLSIDSILLGRLYRTEKGIDITVKLIDSKSGAVMTVISASYDEAPEIKKEKKGSGFIGKWDVTDTAPYLLKQDMRYEKLILNNDGSFSLHMINNADRIVEIQGNYKIRGNNIDYRPLRMFFDGSNTSFLKKSNTLQGTIYLVQGKLYFNYVGTGKNRERLDAMQPEYRCVAERIE